MYHYVYYSYEEWGRGYIGSRSCKCLPDEDTNYFGSYYDKTFNPTQKIIISTFPSREEAIYAEIKLHNFFEVDINPNFSNQAKQRSTGFTSRGTGMKVCLERYPNFHSEAGKIGGKTTHKKHPNLASETGKKSYENGLKVWIENNREEWQRAMRENGLKNAEFYRNDPEAARKRAKNGCKAMQQYWKNHERCASLKHPVKVTLPDGRELTFESKSEAARQLGIPWTTWRRILNGQMSPRSKWAGYSVTRDDTLEIES